MKFFADVIKIIDGGIRGDVKKVVDYSNLLAGKLYRNNDKEKADRILKIIEKLGQANISGEVFFNNLNEKNTNSPKQLPFDQESKLELADIILPNHIIDRKLILSRDNEKQVEEFINSYQKADELAAHGLEIPTTILLFGPPGCGKTETALNIANRLNLPIVIARIDTLISSYLGSTSKNIRFLFDYASKVSCVLFLDEFDAMAKLRNDIHEMGELKRVVNSLLQNIDAFSNKSILIAATNHEKLLDSAIWRRFNTRINIGLPNKEIIREVIKETFKDVGYDFDSKSADFLTYIFSGQSIADIQQVLRRSLGKAILEKRKVVLADVIDVYFSYININIDNTDTDTVRRNKIKYILNIKNDLSNRFLGEIMHCHHNTIKNDIEKIMKEGVIDG